MEVLYPRCAGLDVHSRCVNACVRIAAGRKVTTEHREFATTTAGLLELAAWLTEAGCTHVPMEATGVYWKPVWHVLEDEESFTLVLANAQHIRNVPGRKSDRNDAAWIADLLAHGLIRGSFVPPAPIQELRDLTRTRKQLVREITRHTQRLQKTLEDANVKLDARGHRHPGRQRPGDPGGAHRRGDRSRAAGRLHHRAPESRPRGHHRRGARPGDGAPPFPAGAAPGADRRVARRRAETGAAGRRGAAPFSRGRRAADDDPRGQ